MVWKSFIDSINTCEYRSISQDLASMSFILPQQFRDCNKMSLLGSQPFLIINERDQILLIGKGCITLKLKLLLSRSLKDLFFGMMFLQPL